MKRTGALSYSAIQMLEQARGLNTEGHAVITKKFCSELIEELERLYDVEAILLELFTEIKESQGVGPNITDYEKRMGVTDGD